MAEVKRYNLDAFDRFSKHPNGGWVSSHDYDALAAERNAALAEVERLTHSRDGHAADVTEMCQVAQGLRDEITRLKADDERLNQDFKVEVQLAWQLRLDLAAANRTIRAMGETADRERAKLATIDAEEAKCS